MITILEKYLHKNKCFRIAESDLKLQLISHPDYPGLKSVTDTLDYFGIINIAINAPKEVLDQLPDSFLASVSNQQNGNAMVVKRKNNIELHFEDGQRKTITADEFKEIWTGDTIVIEEASDKKKIVVHGFSGWIVLSLAVFVLLQAVSLTFPSLLLSLLSLSGLYLSYLIVSEEMGIHNKTVAKVCRAVGNSTCSEVITSSNSKLFGSIALSDACIIFFSGCFMIFSLLGSDYTFLAGIVLLSLPVVLFSLYQQAIVLKKWCALCLGILGVLFLLGVSTLIVPVSFEFSASYVAKAIFIFAIIAILWQLIKPVLVSNFKLEHIQSEFLKFKRNQNLFQALLNSSEAKDNTILPDDSQIYFGAENPLITIHAVTNPLCGFCTESFKTYQKLLTTHHSKIRVNFIFSVQANNMENKATQIATRIVEMYKTEGTEKAWQSLQAWFSTRDIEKWQEQFGVTEHPSDNTMETLLSHRDWCNENKISYTPATVIDDRLFPQEYQIADLLLLIDDIILEKTGKELELVGEA